MNGPDPMAAYPRTAGFRHLGGPLDHTTRWLDADPVTRDPIHLRYTHPCRFEEPAVYEATRVEVADQVWWIYILEGHTPTRGQVIDTYPYLTI